MSFFRAPSSVSRFRFGATATLSLALAGFAGIVGSRLPNTVELTAFRFEAAARPILGPALAERVVVVVVDGLGADHFAEILVTGALREALRRGAFFTSTVESPSWSRTQYATLGTGAGVLVHGIASNAQKRALTVDTIFERVRDAGRARVLFKPKIEWWLELYGAAVGEHTKDFRVALESLRRETRAFAVFHFLDVDDMGHDHGGASRAYRAAIAETGRRIEEIVRTIDLSRDLLVITADHGHTARGGHGGDERVVSRTPLVFVGANIRPREYGESRPHDVAPTVAMALGVEVPRASLGRPLVAAFEMDDAERIRRVTAADDAVKKFVARWAAEVGAAPNGDGSVEATLSAIRARFGEEAGGRVWGRRALALIVAILFVALLDPRRLFSGLPVALGLLGALAAVATFALSGLPWTFSAVRERGDFIVVGILISTIAVGAQGIAWWAVTRNVTDADRRRSLLATGTATLFLAAVAVAAVYAIQGFSIAAIYPTPTTIFGSLLALSLSSGMALYWGVVFLVVAARAHPAPCPVLLAASSATGQTT
jgi:hypothetical protein